MKVLTAFSESPVQMYRDGLGCPSQPLTPHGPLVRRGLTLSLRPLQAVISIKTEPLGSRETAQWLRAFVALLEDLGSVPSLMTTNNCL